tara:strand:+ start:71054 stop:72235 length:1182 start_codon:yes stop_codon:yes gene_type:complete
MILEILFWCAFASVLLTYCLYPLFATFLGGVDTSIRQPAAELTIESLPAISCLVPAHNEESVIRQKIKNFQSLDYPADKLEIIIGDDGSDDRTRQWASELVSDRVRLLPPQQRSGKAATMNRLVQAASHPLLFFSDANVMLESGAIRVLASHFRDLDVGAVTGEVTLVQSGEEIRAGESAYYWMERRIQGAESHLGSVIGVDGGMYLIHRDRFSLLPPDTILDDFFVSMSVIRAGYRVVYDAGAKAVESGTPTARQEFARRVRIAAGAVQLLRRGLTPRIGQPRLLAQFVSHKLLRWISPLLLMVMITTSLMLWEHGFVYRFAFVAQAAFWLITLLVASSHRLRRHELGSIIFYFGLSQAAILIGLLKGIFNRQSVRWERTARGFENSIGERN